MGTRAMRGLVGLVVTGIALSGCAQNRSIHRGGPYGPPPGHSVPPPTPDPNAAPPAGWNNPPKAATPTPPAGPQPMTGATTSPNAPTPGGLGSNFAPQPPGGNPPAFTNPGSGGLLTGTPGTSSGPNPNLRTTTPPAIPNAAPTNPTFPDFVPTPMPAGTPAPPAKYPGS